ncbi:arylsulfatase [Puniceicoccales bacterium CK1056]|uniref:Arylsulfatase n=1 Tax=Oceanipulchritudo coccoides TaxID=2706888 RepID=A0A6B2LZJ9_9BACT|nr:arylsulfatase [Oceanipulchritudo coccoides]NDV61486.1 arylsulfatase [Oceanipulchritudo coccoides]
MKLLKSLTIAAFCLLSGSLFATSLPNVVFVFADDIGPGDIAYYHRLRTGKEPIVPTPNMDALIREGIRFSDAHSSAALCAPSRFSVMTGNYPFRCYSQYGVWGVQRKTGIDPKYTTGARIVKEAGYRTAFLGKWGLGGRLFKEGSDELYDGWGLDGADISKLAIAANDYGFDYSLELPQGIQGEPFAFYENKKWMPLGEDSILTQLTPVQTMYYISRKEKDRAGRGDSNWDPSLAGEVLTSKAVKFIEDHRKNHPDKPFFMHYSTQAVHIPHTPPAELDGVKIANSTPGVHGDMVRELDVQIGILRRALEENCMAENTLFILTSDNGGLVPDPAMEKLGYDSTNGFRGIKGGIYEGGHRVPFIAVWPGKIKPGTESSELVVTHDIVATLAAVSGQELDTSKVLDSNNLAPLFLGEPEAKGHDFLLHQSATKNNYAIRDEKFKLIVNVKNQKSFSDFSPRALFDMSDNVLEVESKNLVNSKEHAPVVKQLMATLESAVR